MSKALVISVGTGIGDEPTVARAIVFSIKANNPDKVFYVVSPDSERQVLPEVLAQCSGKPYEVWKLTDPEDVNKTFAELKHKFQAVRREFDQLVADYTSGTKTMSAALAILGSLLGADTLSYVGGHRVKGVVAPGSEKLLTVFPYAVTAQLRFAEAIALFNSCQYETALRIVEEIKARLAYPLLPAELPDFEYLARAYSAWDKFRHDEARELLSKIKMKEVDGNKEFLNRLNKEELKEPYCIADLLNNATRRGNIECKYDDAVARLYRAMEMLAQWKLKVDHGIPNTGDVPKEKLPPGFQLAAAADGTLKLGLRQCYQLLAEFGDPVGRMFTEDSEFLGLLEARNNSILAHGTKPVDRSTYEKFCDKVSRFAASALQGRHINLERLTSLSRFITWT